MRCCRLVRAELYIGPSNKYIPVILGFFDRSIQKWEFFYEALSPLTHLSGVHLIDGPEEFVQVTARIH